MQHHHRTAGVSLLLVLVTSGCGRMLEADMRVKTLSTPLAAPGGDAQVNPNTPAPHNPTPSPGKPAVTPTPAGPTPAPAPAPAPTPPVIIPASFAASNGTSAATVSLNVVFGTNPSFSSVEVRRLAGPTPPDCMTGVIVKTFAAPFAASAAFTDQSDSAGQAQSYVACFIDAAGNPTASSQQPTVVTKPQILFAAPAGYTGSLGGSAGADSLCAQAAKASQNPAVSSETTWQAVISDSSISANQRARLLGQIAASDFSTSATYHTLFSTPTQVWSTGLAATSGSILDAAGRATQALAWTGSDASGNYLSNNTCNDWTTANASGTGFTGDASTLTGTGWANGGNGTSCNQQRALYCLSESAAILRGTTGATLPNSIDLTITPPAQWTAGGSIEIHRRAFPALPSTDCVSATDTPIDTIAPLSGATVVFTDDQAAAATAYNYRACLFDMNGNLVFSSLALHVVTSP